MTSINTNIASQIAANALRTNERSMGTAMERLSTGMRINSAKDDAAGLAIANRMGSQVVSLKMASKNAQDGISMLQTLDGATKEISTMLNRMRELFVQHENETNSSTDLTNLESEYAALVAEITRITEDTSWNGMKLISTAGNAALTTAGQVDLQVGSESGNTISVSVADLQATVAGTVTTLAALAGNPSAIDTAIDAVSAERAAYGAYISRLEHASDNLMNVATNLDSSRGRIEDADYAAETTELARTQIIAQAGTAMLAQANQIKQSVLALLK
jgi:flagellin